jgi:DNA-binding transcriptional regulator of glucitol operon
MSSLVVEGYHLWIKDVVLVGMFWWQASRYQRALDTSNTGHRPETHCHQESF